VKNEQIRLWIGVAVLWVSPSAWGQIPELDSVTGEVHVDSTVLLHGTVKLSEIQDRRTLETDLKGDGSFVFRHVLPGEYRLTVLDSGERPIQEQMVSVRNQTQIILVEVPSREIPRPPSAGVSAAELLHPPSKKAWQAFLAARKLSDRGEHEKAAAELEKTIQLSPEYADGWIELAAQHLFMGRHQQALDELARAISLSRPTALILGDMAFGEFGLHHSEEGAYLARQALQLDPTYAPAHYLLGSFLVLDRRTFAEGLKHLEVASRTMPAAAANLEQARRNFSAVTHP
jgi:tetratricopeptide (TPR) repeat protein